MKTKGVALDDVFGRKARGADRVDQKRGVALDDVFGRKARGEVVQHDRDEHAGARDARFSVADVRIDGDVVAPVHALA